MRLSSIARKDVKQTGFCNIMIMFTLFQISSASKQTKRLQKAATEDEKVFRVNLRCFAEYEYISEIQS